jgi:Tfp pilus assembly protein PilO
MKHLSKEKRDRLLLVCIGTVAAVAGLYYSMIASQRDGLKTLAAKYVESESKFQNAQKLIGKSAAIQQSLETASGKLKAIESRMASGDMYSWIILTINSFKENYRVDIPQFSREVPSEVGMFAKFPYRAAVFNVRGTAHYHDFGKFVADFENAYPYMRIQNFELEPSAASNSTAQNDQEKLTFKMEIVALVNPAAH